jgi:ABC-2 type transport system ATP-binding protein
VNAIGFRNVTLWRRTQEEFSYDLKRSLFRLLHRRARRPRRRRTITELSFEIARGEKVGLIGPNGSGKSTVLKLAARILRPTSGNVDVAGHVAALIELGAGFDGDLTVCENVLYYGMLLGFSRAEIRSRLPGILEFAELRDYADIPLKALSSGMNARLSFAIATEVRPDILLIDEVLSVGDEAFRRKSSARMDALWNAHSTIVSVSHDLPFIADSCDRAIWMDQGTIRRIGGAREVVEAYLRDVDAHEIVTRLEPSVPHALQPATGYVDELLVEGRRVTVSGWGILGRGSRRGDHIAVFVDGRKTVEAPYDVERPDVLREYPEIAEPFTGFRIGFNVDDGSGELRVDCAVFDASERRYYLIGDSRTVAVSS